MRIQLVGGVAALALAVALSGCSSSATKNAVGVGGTTSAAGSAPSTSEQVPSVADLNGALLSASDLGPTFAVQPSDTASASDTGQASGCAQLSALINSPQSQTTPSGTNEAQVVLAGGQTGPFVGEFLTGAPSNRLDHQYPAVVEALKSCQQLNLPTGNTQIPFRLSNVDFGTPGSVAKRMDGTVDGVPVNGYLALDRLSPTVALVYLFIQVGGDSSQAALGYYHQAVTKADAQLGLTTSASET